MLTRTEQDIHDLFGLGMVSRLAVRGLMLLICLGGLVQGFEYCGETEGITGPNLIGRSTSNEFVTEVSLVLGALLVLHRSRCNQHRTAHVTKPRRANIPDGEP
jgi:hypothetical protein